jgi:HlyD family secretion protein
MNSKIFITTLTSIISALIIWIAYTFYLAYQPTPMVLQGQIDARVYSISSEVPGRVENLSVKKGDLVKKGDYIYSIDSPQLDAKATQADAAKNAAQAIKDETYEGARKQEIKVAQQNYMSAKSAEELLKKTYDRINALYKEGVLPKQRIDELKAELDVAKHTKNAAYEIYQMAKVGSREQTKKAASANEMIFEGKVQEVNAYLKETKQYSHHDGEVSQVLLHDGELAPQGFPVVMITDMSDIWAKFFVREDFLKHFQKGKVVDVSIPALSKDAFKFEVTYINVMGDYATWKASQAGKGFDLKSFEVELKPLQNIENLRVGMSTLVEIKE